jgi:hypothetical protein
MRKLKSVRQAHQFLIAHAAISNVFNFDRQVIRAETFRHLRKVRLQNGEGRLLELAQCHS